MSNPKQTDARKREQIVHRIKKEIEKLVIEEGRRVVFGEEAYTNSGRKKKAMRIRLKIGGLAEEYRAHFWDGKNPMATLAKEIGCWSEVGLLKLRQFYRLSRNDSELVEGWIEDGKSWTEIVTLIGKQSIPRPRRKR